MNREVYTALIEAGASEEKAIAAAESIAGYDNHFSRIESTLRLHGWMLTYLVGVTTAIAFDRFM